MNGYSYADEKACTQIFVYGYRVFLPGAAFVTVTKSQRRLQIHSLYQYNVLPRPRLGDILAKIFLSCTNLHGDKS